MVDPVPNDAQPGWFFRWIVAPACGAWAWLRERLLALKPCRVSVLMVLAGLVFFLAVPQGEDVLRALAEREAGPRDEWQRACFFIAAFAWSWSGWYWARVMLSLKFPGVPPSDSRLHRVRIWAPRLLGFLATFGVAAALYSASLGYDDREHHAVKLALQRYAFWCALGAVFFLAIVSLRRGISRAVYDKVKGLSLAQGRVAAPIAGALDVRSSADEVFGNLEFSDLKPLTRWLLSLAILAAGALLLLFAFALQPSAPFIGTAAILLLAAAGWIAVGSTLDFFGMRLEMPVFSTLLVLAIVFGLWNGNHDVRTLPAAQPAPPRPDLHAALRSWIARQPARPGGSIPMVLVDAEGGGIRAAYWTAMVLGRIQDRNPCFAEQLFSLSGVSGGSLGASVFVALLAEQRSAGGDACRGGKAPFSIEAKARDILGEDFLSPVVAGFLYPDLAQRFIPWPVRSFDRALALEEAWERAWRKHTASNRFAEPLERLWQDPSAWTPALLLNATWVETGKRLIASNLRLRVPGADEDFVDVEDAREFFAPRSLRLSTAAHMSARFTYVSPAGALKKSGSVHGHVVDGGYFENSGATATIEILETLPILAKEDPDHPWANVDPVVIHISNEPVAVPVVPGTLEKAPENLNIRPSLWLNESLSPIRAMLNTRDARGVHARATAYWHVGSENFLHFGLCRRSTNIPLGWVLSRSTQDRMKAQLDAPNPDSRVEACSFDNAGDLDKIRARVSAPAGK